MVYLGIGFIILGLFFSIIGVIGMLLLPNVYSRLHSSGKVSALGLFGLLAGVAILLPSSALKALGLGIFLIISAPVTSHAIARAVRLAEREERDPFTESPQEGLNTP